jgi:RNA polymerase sigma-70 factor (ECF subfamily)
MSAVLSSDRRRPPSTRTLSAARGTTIPRAQPRWRTDPDVALMLRVQRDDAAAFAELVKRYWLRVFGRFLRRLNQREEAEDLVQEVFLRVYRHRKRYHPRARFGTWLFHISQNALRNALRARRRHPQAQPLTSADSSYPVELFADRGEAPWGRADREDVARVVRRAVSDLGGRQRTALELHEFQGRTYDEIAASMHMSPEAAKSLLYRARIQLRQRLAGATDLCS